jgi:hypothetical protein
VVHNICYFHHHHQGTTRSFPSSPCMIIWSRRVSWGSGVQVREGCYFLQFLCDCVNLCKIDFGNCIFIIVDKIVRELYLMCNCFTHIQARSSWVSISRATRMRTSCWDQGVFKEVQEEQEKKRRKGLWQCLLWMSYDCFRVLQFICLPSSHVENSAVFLSHKQIS